MNRRVDDKVFLLSIGEANIYFHSNREEQCIPTAYAKANGALGSDNSKSESACPWWLRSPGQYNRFATYITDDGSIEYSGRSVNDNNTAVRPAMWIELIELS